MDLNIHKKNFTPEKFLNTIHDVIRPQQTDEVRNAFNVQLVAVKRTGMPEVDEQSISEKPGT